MNNKEQKGYESPSTKKAQVELEDGICAASHTGLPVVDENNNKVKISEQQHGSWNGIGDDISTSWE